jgi:hypothetical protein
MNEQHKECFNIVIKYVKFIVLLLEVSYAIHINIKHYDQYTSMKLECIFASIFIVVLFLTKIFAHISIIEINNNHIKFTQNYISLIFTILCTSIYIIIPNNNVKIIFQIWWYILLSCIYIYFSAVINYIIFCYLMHNFSKELQRRYSEDIHGPRILCGVYFLITMLIELLYLCFNTLKINNFFNKTSSAYLAPFVLSILLILILGIWFSSIAIEIKTSPISCVIYIALFKLITQSIFFFTPIHSIKNMSNQTVLWWYILSNCFPIVLILVIICIIGIIEYIYKDCKSVCEVCCNVIHSQQVTTSDEEQGIQTTDQPTIYTRN